MSRPPTSEPHLLPREHGAYGQLAFPLVTTALVAGVSGASLTLAAATIAGFLAHEPLLIVIGRRGPRARREQGRRALSWLVVVAVAGIAAAVAAVWLMPSAWRWSLAVPAVPAAALGLVIAAGEEKSTPGELTAAVAFAAVALPLALGAGADLRQAATLATVFALSSVLQMLAVRSVILEVRGGGNPRAARGARWTALALAAAGGLALAMLASRRLLPWSAPVAILPGVATTVWLALFPPPPTRLRTVGWTLVTATAVAAIVLITGL